MTSSIRRHCSVGAPATGPSSITPALLTRMSRPPSSSLVRVTKAFACSSSVTSVSIASALPPSPSIRSARSSRRSLRRAASETAAPSAARASAVASPIPEEAPVIAATLPSSGPTARPYTAFSLPSAAPNGPGKRTRSGAFRRSSYGPGGTASRGLGHDSASRIAAPSSALRERPHVGARARPR